MPTLRQRQYLRSIEEEENESTSEILRRMKQSLVEKMKSPKPSNVQPFARALQKFGLGSYMDEDEKNLFGPLLKKTGIGCNDWFLKR